MLELGGKIALIKKIVYGDGETKYVLKEAKVNKIEITERYGRRYFTDKYFRPLDADDLDSNTEIMKRSLEKEFIFIEEPFGISELTKKELKTFLSCLEELN